MSTQSSNPEVEELRERVEKLEQTVKTLYELVKAQTPLAGIIKADRVLFLDDVDTVNM